MAYINDCFDCDFIKPIAKTIYTTKREHDIKKVLGFIWLLLLFQMFLNKFSKKLIYLQTYLVALKLKTLEIKWLYELNIIIDVQDTSYIHDLHNNILELFIVFIDVHYVEISFAKE